MSSGRTPRRRNPSGQPDPHPSQPTEPVTKSSAPSADVVPAGGPPDAGEQPASGPVWTRDRLERLLLLRWAVPVKKEMSVRIDTGGIAEAMGVTRRTVQRWLRAPSSQSLTSVPPRRLTQILELLTPSQETRGREQQMASYARESIATFDLPRRIGIKPAWEAQMWLEPHLVAVIEVPVVVAAEVKTTIVIRQVTLGVNSLDKFNTFSKRGQIIDQVVVPSRFHANLLAARVLEETGPWRYQASLLQVRQGFTWTWTSDAPDTHLSRWRDDLPQQVPPRRREAPQKKRTTRTKPQPDAHDALFALPDDSSADEAGDSTAEVAGDSPADGVQAQAPIRSGPPATPTESASSLSPQPPTGHLPS